MRSSKPHPRDASDAAVHWMRACSLTSIVMLTGTVVKFVVVDSFQKEILCVRLTVND